LCLLSFSQHKRIDSLNELGCTYAASAKKADWDTAMLYIKQAYQESQQLNYTAGITGTIFNKALMEMNSHSYRAAERNFRKCLSYYESISDTIRLGWVKFNLGYVLYVQGYFDQAMAAFQGSVPHFQETAGYREHVSKVFGFLGVIYGLKGELEKGFELAQNALAESQKQNDSLGMVFPLMIIGDLYQSMGDGAMALAYYHESAVMGRGLDIYASAQMAAAHNAAFRFDSAFYYLQNAIARDSGQLYFQIILGEIYLQQKKYKEALVTFQKTVPILEKNNGRKERLRVFLAIAKTYMAQDNNRAALRYARRCVKLAQTMGARQYLAKGFELISSIYGKMGIHSKAFMYLTHYIHLKDSLLSDQFKAKIFAYRSVVENEKKQSLIEQLRQEKLVSQQQLKIKQQQLQRSSLLKNSLIGGSLAFALLCLFVFRYLMLQRRNEKLQSERKQAALQHKTVELEMQALRSQMNPHFIFNSLNSINEFILQKDKNQASGYLTKFSRLVRLILHNSQAALIPLESELEALQLYLELESLRFNDHFDFAVNTEEDLDVAAVKIPPLIIQPYAENAIWHGLMHKKEKGHLSIEISQQDDVLYCRIADDGIGRQKAAALKSKSNTKHRSMGMHITADRIALLQQQNQIHVSTQISDLVLPDGSAGGTEVQLKLPIRYD
jgi:tetratricopeptide (TPR) repeat protein